MNITHREEETGLSPPTKDSTTKLTKKGLGTAVILAIWKAEAEVERPETSWAIK